MSTEPEPVTEDTTDAVDAGPETPGDATAPATEAAGDRKSVV